LHLFVSICFAGKFQRLRFNYFIVLKCFPPGPARRSYIKNVLIANRLNWLFALPLRVALPALPELNLLLSFTRLGGSVSISSSGMLTAGVKCPAQNSPGCARQLPSHHFSNVPALLWLESARPAW
jgi:hypothetical protein